MILWLIYYDIPSLMIGGWLPARNLGIYNGIIYIYTWYFYDEKNPQWLGIYHDIHSNLEDMGDRTQVRYYHNCHMTGGITIHPAMKCWVPSGYLGNQGFTHSHGSLMIGWWLGDNWMMIGCDWMLIIGFQNYIHNHRVLMTIILVGSLEHVSIYWE